MKVADKKRNKVKRHMARMKKRFDNLYPNKNISTQSYQDNTVQLARDKEKLNLRDLQEEYLE